MPTDNLATQRDLADEAIQARLSIGSNNPPDPIALLIADLRETHTPLVERADALLGMTARLPEVCEDDDTAVSLTDMIKSCTAFTKNSDAARVSAKEPHLAAGRAVDGFFKKLSDPVDALKVKMSNLLTAFQRKKADEERRRLQAEAAEAKRLADEEARIAREERAKAEEARRLQAEAEAEVARLKAAAEEAERKAAEDAKRREREAIDAKSREAARLAQIEADKAAAVRREQARVAHAEADRLTAERAEQERVAKEARDRQSAARQEANVSRSDATVKAAELTRSRSDLGAVASLRTTWAFELVDLADVPRTYLSLNDGAVRAAIKAATTRDGKCALKIPGVRIYEKQESVVR